MKNIRKFNHFDPPSRSQITPRRPQAWSRWLKIDPRRFQDDLQECFCRCSKSPSIWRRLGVVLGSILAPVGLTKCLPFGTLLAPKIDRKIDPKSKCAKGRSKIAPRAPKTLPRCPPDTPRSPEDASRTAPGDPQMSYRTPRDDPKAFPKHLAQSPCSEESKR